MSLDAVALVILSKYPTPGRVKTRLTPALTPQQAAAVHRIFLQHLVRRLRDMGPAELIVCFDPPEARQAMADLLAREGTPTLMPQVAGDLGRRLAAIVAEVGRLHPRFLLLAVDSPDVPAGHIRRVAEMTAEADLALGLADDGGYWCLGLTREADPAALLHSGIEWSSARTAADTLANAHALNYRTAAGYSWGDVDQPQDLRDLMARLACSADVDDARLRLELIRELPASVLNPGNAG